LPCDKDNQSGCTGKITNFDASNTSDKLGEYLNTMIRIFIGLCAVLAVVMIVIGGMEYMTSELTHSKEHGKEQIWNAVIGLLIALAAYALLFTINPDILKTKLDSLTQATITIDIEDSVPQTYDPITKKYANGAVYGTPLTGTPTPLPSGVTLNNNGLQCTSVGQLGCTSTIGLNMSNVLDAQKGCGGCPIVLTGGTEWWAHGGKKGSTSHQQGSATVDLRSDNGPLDAYLSGGKPLVNRQRYPSPNGPMYETDGGNHWHIGA
jgi:uncharacterized membrane protein